MRIVIDLQGAQSESRYRGIGRYSLSLAMAIARNRGEHEVIIALSGLFPETIEEIRAAFDGILPQENIRVWEAPGPVRESDTGNETRREIAEILREAFLSNLKADVTLITSLFEGFVDDAVTSIKKYDKKAKTVVVLYDLIPYIHKDKYLIHNHQYKKHYLAKIEHLKKADLLLGISQSSSNEAIEYLGVAPNNIVTISSAVDESFHPHIVTEETKRELFSKYQIDRKTIVYAPGGFDVRKNFENLIKAYAQLPKTLVDSYQLVIVSKVDDGNKANLLRVAKQAGLKEDDLVLTGYVSDEELISFYSVCDLFVFPSIHEGFGLPVLEAMNCDAIVIGSNTTSIPEVIGYDEALFDPSSVESIRDKIAQVLQDKELQGRLKKHYKKQVQKFSWDESAKVAISAMASNFNTYLPEVESIRKKLAYFSPLPPQRSGISDYSAELLPYLSEYYDITLIVNSDECQNVFGNKTFEIYPIEWYMTNSNQFDRVVFHFGNSPFHTYMIEALKYKSGVVFMHDFFMSGMYAYEEIVNGREKIWSDAIYRSHGYKALQKRFQKDGEENAKLEFPVNYNILENSTGILSHSQYSKELFIKNYNLSRYNNWHVVPFIKHLPKIKEKESIRKKLNFSNEDFLICSFGFIDSTKQNYLLLEAFISSSLSKLENCKLIYVGENHGGEYGQKMLNTIVKYKLQDKVIITGWTECETYSDYLAIADAGVQLRTLSRGETSAAIFDCMSNGIATIINANGSFAEIDKDSVCMLEDDFTISDLQNALEKIHDDEKYRKQLGSKAKELIKTKHNPAICAKQYFDAIESSYKNSIDINAVIRSVASIKYLSQNDNELMRIAEIISENFPSSMHQKQLLIDVSTICRDDLRTGIERVVRAQLMEMFKKTLNGYRVEPVYLTDEGGFWHYKYARRFTCDFLNIPTNILHDEKVQVAEGDIFFCADFYRDGIVEASRSGLYEKWKKTGVSINFLIHDLLPITNPEFFPEGSSEPHLEWIKSICKYSHHLICISHDVKKQLKQMIKDKSIDTSENILINVVHHGADIDSSLPTIGLPKEAETVLKKLSQTPTFSMVGTIEPRKGHLQTVIAFEKLWEQGVDINLVIVGKEGWKGLADEQRRTIPKIVQKIKSHRELNKKLFWLEGISDEYLEKIYAASTCLIAASEGEGFGLPLIEAAQYKKPIIARDIPVFKEVAGEFAHYFKNDNDPQVLADTIKEWLELYKENKHPKSDTMSWLTWEESTKMLLNKLRIV